MPYSKNVNKFWSTFTRALHDIQQDFNDLDGQEKQAVTNQLAAVLHVQGITVSADFLLRTLQNSRPF